MSTEDLAMNEELAPSLLVIVPRAGSEACRRLQQTLGAGIHIVVDRRSGDRRSRLDAQQLEPHVADRRARADRDAALAAGKWVVVANASHAVDVLDADARAILFLYCAQHSVPCQRCQETYRLGWLVRTDAGLACPRCGDDLTSIVVAHAQRCENWVHRRAGEPRPPARMDGPAPPRRVAAG
jgi:hypothetical protein